MSQLPPRSSIAWADGNISFIDQTKLPASFEIIETDDGRVIAGAIRRLAIRGAPLIGVAAAFAVAAEAIRAGREDAKARCHEAIESLRATRPTAVNLFSALERMRSRLDSLEEKEIAVGLEDEAVAIFDEDRARCDAIGEAGFPLLPDNARILTICNTGYLATAGIGTALGVIYRGSESGRVSEVLVPETRPLLQGARLTAWELGQAGIKATLLVDGAIGAALRTGVDLAIIGADRIAANGDTANKIGSLPLALSCKRFNVPLYVAAPLTTFDPETSSGREITVEMRGSGEVSSFAGIETGKENQEAFNPAFDIVEADLISGFITEAGVFRSPYLFNNRWHADHQAQFESAPWRLRKK